MAVDSPCIGACWIDETMGWCRGCGRTRDEVAAWPTADDDRKRAILAQLPDRVRQLNARGARPSRAAMRRQRFRSPEAGET